ncbi:MAG: NUDIX domain-containing protein, partial [Gemmatimonadaceae bacterium]|nr:NUDIX domain-containing protein [Gemmatimonadaceae bacterium]
MPDRPSPPAARATARRTSLTIDVVLLTPHGRRLTILLTRASDPKAKERWELPWDSVHAEETLEETAARLARTALGVPPTLIEQVAAFGDRRRHPAGADVSVAFLALV